MLMELAGFDFTGLLGFWENQRRFTLPASEVSIGLREYIVIQIGWVPGGIPCAIGLG